MTKDCQQDRISHTLDWLHCAQVLSQFLILSAVHYPNDNERKQTLGKKCWKNEIIGSCLAEIHVLPQFTLQEGIYDAHMNVPVASFQCLLKCHLVFVWGAGTAQW